MLYFSLATVNVDMTCSSQLHIMDVDSVSALCADCEKSVHSGMSKKSLLYYSLFKNGTMRTIAAL